MNILIHERCSRCLMSESADRVVFAAVHYHGIEYRVRACKDIEACFYRVGILLRHFETDRNLNHDGRGWHTLWRGER